VARIADSALAEVSLITAWPARRTLVKALALGCMIGGYALASRRGMTTERNGGHETPPTVIGE